VSPLLKIIKSKPSNGTKEKITLPNVPITPDQFESELKNKTGGELRAIIQELEKSVKYDSDGKLRKNKLNGPRRKSIEGRIVIAKEVLSGK
jgi:hypothetical protein